MMREENYMQEKHIYEVIRFEQGVALFIEEHLERLYKSAEQCNIKTNIQANDIYKKYNEATYNENKIINLRIDVFENRFQMSFSEPIKTNDTMYKYGINVKTVLCERKNPNIKSNEESYYSKISSNSEQNDIFEFILYDNNILKEGTRSNFFGIKNNVIYTQNNKTVLMGVTRNIIINLAHSIKISILYEDIYLDEISQMDAFFITGTSIGVLPIKKIDQFEYNSAKNETLIKLHNEYNNYVNNYIKLKKR